MKRLLGAVVAMLSLVGCQRTAPPNDPFLYRSTIPPPGTITPGVAPAGQPYYPARRPAPFRDCQRFRRAFRSRQPRRSDRRLCRLLPWCLLPHEQIRHSRRIQLSKFTPVPGGNPSASIQRGNFGEPNSN